MVMKLAIMTKSTFFVEEDKILTALFEVGMDNLHLHKVGSSQLYSERLLSLIPSNFLSKIILHENLSLINEYKLAGVHLNNASDMSPEGYKGVITRSCTDLNMLKNLKKKANYVILHNIFDSIEYKGEKSSFTKEQLEEAARSGLIDRHVYAMGGMGVNNIKIAKDLGFGGVVVCGDLWERFDIYAESDFKKVLTHFERLKKATG